MKVIAVAVCSLNGKITRGNDPNVSSWSSPEDQKYFQKLISEQKLIVMGSQTYEVAKNTVVHKQSRLRVVMTSQPQKYKADEKPGMLEFTDRPVLKIVKYYREKSYQTLLLTGGSQIYSAFFVANLVDELWLTIEPLIFSQGKPLLSETNFETKLKLISLEQLNPRGTLLLKYIVV